MQLNNLTHDIFEAAGSGGIVAWKSIDGAEHGYVFDFMTAAGETSLLIEEPALMLDAIRRAAQADDGMMREAEIPTACGRILRFEFASTVTTDPNGKNLLVQNADGDGENAVPASFDWDESGRLVEDTDSPCFLPAWLAITVLEYEMTDTDIPFGSDLMESILNDGDMPDVQETVHAAVLLERSKLVDLTVAISKQEKVQRSRR